MNDRTMKKVESGIVNSFENPVNRAPMGVNISRLQTYLCFIDPLLGP